MLSFGSLGPDVILSAQAAIIDHLACGLSGSGLPWTVMLRRALLGPGRAAPSGAAVVYGASERTTASQAALINGTAAHGIELDDIYGRLHPGSIVISSAIASAFERDCDGRELLMAIVLGYEIMGRIERAIGVWHSDRGFHTTGVVGPFGAAAAVCRIQGMGPDETRNAIGIAASFGAGIKAFVQGPGMVKRLHAGRAAESGVIAADLARVGYLGPADPLAGRYGFCEIFAGPGEFRPERLTDGLLDSFAITDTYLKPYPCCGAIHGAIRAAETLRRQEVFSLDEVEMVNIGTSRHGLQKSQPHPVDVMTTQYSLESGVTLALLGLAGDPQYYDPDFVLAGEAGRVLGLMRAEVDEEADARFPASVDGRVTIRLRGGREISRYGVGHGGENLTPGERWTESAAKFERLTATILSAQEQRLVIRAVTDLPEGCGVGPELARILGKPARAPAE